MARFKELRWLIGSKTRLLTCSPQVDPAVSQPPVNWHAVLRWADIRDGTVLLQAVHKGAKRMKIKKLLVHIKKQLIKTNLNRIF
jgi:hypothetical protein